VNALFFLFSLTYFKAETFKKKEWQKKDGVKKNPLSFFLTQK
jgi:hypothetical protein